MKECEICGRSIADAEEHYRAYPACLEQLKKKARRKAKSQSRKSRR